MIALATDLPLLTAADLRALVGEAEARTAVIAPDRDAMGTNAVAVAPPEFDFQFGPGSFARHVEEAKSRDLAVRVVRTRGLEFDLDLPADLRHVDVPI